MEGPSFQNLRQNLEHQALFRHIQMIITSNKPGEFLSRIIFISDCRCRQCRRRCLRLTNGSISLWTSKSASTLAIQKNCTEGSIIVDYVLSLCVDNVVKPLCAKKNMDTLLETNVKPSLHAGNPQESCHSVPKGFTLRTLNIPAYPSSHLSLLVSPFLETNLQLQDMHHHQASCQLISESQKYLRLFKLKATYVSTKLASLEYFKRQYLKIS